MEISLRQFHLKEIVHTQKGASPWATAICPGVKPCKTASVTVPNVMLSTVFLLISTVLFFYTYIPAFVIGLTVDIIKDIVQQGRVRFFSYHWNYVAVATVVSYGLGSALWWTSQYSSPEEEAKHFSQALLITSNSLRALAILLACVHNLSFFQANTSIGPLLSAFTQMLVDVAKFFLYFVFVFLAFAVSFSELYTLYEQEKDVPWPAKPKQESNRQKLERCVQPC